MERDNNQRRLSRYLLGDLSEAEQAEVETDYFEHNEKFEEVWAAENDLIDDYLRGNLTRNDRELFETRFLSSPRRRQQLSAASILLKSISSVQPETRRSSRTKSSTTVSRVPLLPRPGRSKPLFAFALGGLVILCLLGLAWGFIEMGRLRRELLRSQTEHADQLARERELEAQEAAGREQLEQVTQDLARVRDQLAALEARKPEEPGAAHLFSFILTGGLARVGGPTPTLRLPPGMEAVALKVARDDKDYRNYSAALRTAEGAEVWTWTSVRAIPRRSGTEIVLKVPAARLARNDYTLRLTGISSTGVAEDAGQYYFRVER